MRLTSLAVVVAAAVVLRAATLWRGRPEPADHRTVWRLLTAGAALIGVAALTAVGLQHLAGVPSTVAGIVFLPGCLLALGPMYQGLIHWNRRRTPASDPGDWLNFVGAVAALSAIGELGSRHVSRGLSGADLVQQHAAVLAAAAVLTFLGTALSLAVIAGLRRDVRLWLVVAAAAVVPVTHVVAIGTGAEMTPPMSLAAWLVLAAVVSICPSLPARAVPTRTATAQATSVGALVVLLGGVGAFIAQSYQRAYGTPLVSLYAATAVLAASLRFARLVGDLAGLLESRRLAMTDDLTGVPNRRAVLSGLDEARRRQRPVSLLVLGIDGFTRVNDGYGHAVGDDLLQHLSYAFAQHVPRAAVLGRLGGDEFAVLLPGRLADAETLADAATLAQRLVEATATVGRAWTPPLRIAAAVGVAVGPAAGRPGADEPPGGELMRQARVAMFRARRSGTSVEVYDQALDTAERERDRLGEDLQEVLASPERTRAQLVLHYQPQVDLQTEVVRGAEALVRWQHPRHGLLEPEAFLPLAERAGLMMPLTRHVVSDAVEQAGQWRAAGHPLRLSVNVSATCLGDPALLDVLDTALADGAEPGDLVLEITETSLLADAPHALEAARAITERGVGISIDDYGTAYSSLSYLNDLPACELKVDRTFAAGVRDNPRTASIVASTVDLAHRLGMRIVAEGVEDEATLDALRWMDCDEAQGHLFSRPLPGSAFLAWVEAGAGGPAPRAGTPSVAGG